MDEQEHADDPLGAAPAAATSAAAAVAEAPPGDLNLFRSSAVVALGTALSRFTGFGRLAATAYAIGFTRLTDTYTLANTTPNIVYELLLGGVLSATLVPIFVQQRDEGDDNGTNAIVTVASVGLIGVTVVGLITAPWIVQVYTLGVSGSVAADQQQVATSMLRLFMPQMLFYGLTAMATAVLNARRSFAAPAFAPALNNIVVSAVLISLPVLAGGTPTLEDVRDDPLLLWTLGLGTTAGIVVMTLALWPALRRAGVHFRWRLDWRHPSVRQVGRLSSWTFGYVVCNQVALLVVLILANRTEGGVSSYTGAFVFFLLPHALFAVSLMTTLVPELSSAAGRGDLVAFRSRFSDGVRLMAIVVLPAATGYIVLAHPIVTALLERGAFTGASADLTATTLAAFGAGLFGFSVYLFALRGFYALRDTRTPFLINVGQNVAQIALALALAPVFGVPGLAAAYGSAYTAAAVVALVVLHRRVGSLEVRRVTATVARVLVACAVMAAAVTVVSGAVGGDGTGMEAVVRTAAGVGVGGVVYVTAVFALRVEDVTALLARLRR
ncbi:MAG TPA: murein biosynthesis integral membrane protein MurJ [Acidimicrobiales bacterium]|nr:murein biosynthesis integral membrane protein MurJ [Acidimicrobiales bacterium]